MGKGAGIALVGCGGMAANYARRYTQIEGAYLALLVDTNEEAAKKTSEALGGIPWSTHFEDCLRDEIEIVDVSTPNFLHAPQAVAALEAGKHVLLQKPLAPSVEEGEAIAKAARRAKKNAGMYMINLNQPAVYDFKRLIAQGGLGILSGVHCRCAHTGGLTMPAGTWRNDIRRCGGGAFIQLAVHHVHLMQWLMDSEVTSVSAHAQNRMCPSVGGDDVCAAILDFENGVIGSFEAAYCAGQTEYALYGTKGFLKFESNHMLTLSMKEAFAGETFSYTEPGTVMRIPLTETHKLYHMENAADQSIAFVRAVLEGKPAPVSVEEGLRDLAIVEAVYRSAQTGMRVDMRR